ncbi:MAG: (d)CMP kinase [Clostridium sp.]|uniref:(d)CMP kinase n=1 Tax=Clostridium culturomicium TaxID=1499683 RepID=UPI00058C0230|nr:(d)CMP kinase [Clostridium culturomicium]MDU4892574.1 (d)CMP kinase [Clostridium sp.]MDU7084742.1 (d)CMP kinase [Clostridium sp.]
MRTSIAIDGPAGAGKSTIAKLLGKKYDLMYINTGSMYRAVTLFAMKNGIEPNEIEKLCSLIDELEMHFENDDLIVNGVDVSKELTNIEVTNNVSRYAAVPEVRQKLVQLQRGISKNYDVIMDGRDIGTVVLKDASVKIFLTARPEERATRRYEELIAKNVKVDYNSILEDIKKRDYIDSHREVDPLQKAEDAVEVDSSLMNIHEVVEAISKYIEEYKNRA